MKFIPFIIILISFCGHTKNLLLVPLKQTIPLPVSRHAPILVTDGKLLKVREFKGQILATGIKEGKTFLRSGKESYEVYILEPQKIKIFQELQTLLSQKLKLEVDYCEPYICVTGKLLIFKDYKEISEWAYSKNYSWVLKAQIREELKESLKEYISSQLDKHKINSKNLQVFPTLLISLSKTNLTPIQVQALNSLGLTKEESENILPETPMVDLKVDIVEFKKSSFSKFGIESPSTYKASVLPKFEGLPFEIALHSLEQNGEAKIIASPKLSCRSGESAHFLAGGEFPIRIINYQTNDIQWKKHGILLKFNPVVDLLGKIRLSLTAEVSLLDSSQTVDGVPGLLVNRVESHVDMTSGQTITLSGLIKHIQGNSKQGLHTLSQIPILGLLFGSEDYREEKSDLVIFITPHILSLKE